MSSYTLDDLIQERQRTHNFEINDFPPDSTPEPKTPKFPISKPLSKPKARYLPDRATETPAGTVIDPINENANHVDETGKTSMLPIVVVSALLLFVLVK